MSDRTFVMLSAQRWEDGITVAFVTLQTKSIVVLFSNRYIAEMGKIRFFYFKINIKNIEMGKLKQNQIQDSWKLWTIINTNINILGMVAILSKSISRFLKVCKNIYTKFKFFWYVFTKTNINFKIKSKLQYNQNQYQLFW